jgi:hypothetical protein
VLLGFLCRLADTHGSYPLPDGNILSECGALDRRRGWAMRLPDPTDEVNGAGRSRALRIAGRGASGPSARECSLEMPGCRSVEAGWPS